MTIENQIAEVLARHHFEPSFIEEVIVSGRPKNIKAEESLISPGSNTSEIPLVIHGLLRVMRQDAQGSEIFLYYLEGGQTCAMSITCCIERKINNAFHVVAEADSQLWMIPAAQIDNWVTKYTGFRRFVFNSYQSRFDELLTAIDSVVFMKMDERLYKFLLDSKQATGSYTIRKTHEQIASELNTSRVVISRLVKKLEREGKVEQHRNRIEIL